MACAFLEALIEACPYRLHTILTDNGIPFAELPKNRRGPTALYRVNRFDQICRAHDIEHRLIKSNQPWTNGQVERMNRTLQEAIFVEGASWMVSRPRRGTPENGRIRPFLQAMAQLATSPSPVDRRVDHPHDAMSDLGIQHEPPA